MTDLVDKVALAMQDSNGFGGHFADETYMDREDFKLVAKAAIAVVLKEQLAKLEVNNDAYPEECLRAFARENGVSLDDR